MSISVENSQEIDPLMVPTREAWENMSPVERRQKEMSIIAALEQESSLMGETTIHFESRASATEVLRRFFQGKGRTAFIASDLHTLYPGERAFYPDLLVVFDVETHHRRSWNVMREGRGLDFALEILSRETRRKDRVEKLNLYMRIEIPEYFIFDPDLFSLKGYRLIQQIYQEIPPEDGKIFSQILGLYLKVEADKLRFSVPDGLEVPFAYELVEQLNQKLLHKERIIEDYARDLDEEYQRAEDEKQRAEDEKQRAEAEKQRADKAEAELQRLRQLLDLKK
ncbi:MAG: Uma2 family endonuclease [SAR324 cluster bacterium]|nr:Uma2 family endonuclease [SAR324 cluster bacterium]